MTGEKKSLSEVLPTRAPSVQTASGDVATKLGMEFGKSKDINLWLLRLMQKQEDIRGMRLELDKLETAGLINPMQASITRVRMALQEGQDLLLAALDETNKKRVWAMSNGMSTMAQWLSNPNEAYNPVYLAIDDGLNEHQIGFLSRAGQDDYNTMMNIFQMFTTNKSEQKLVQAPLEPVKKEKRKWLPW